MQAAARNLPSRAFGQLHTYLLRDNRQAEGRNLPSRTFGQLHTNLLRDNRQAAARILPSRAFGQTSHKSSSNKEARSRPKSTAHRRKL